jgi:hypothetical protein
MLEDESIQGLIAWLPTGDVFVVFNPTEFSKIVLPQYFKHNNWQSFVRQLNMYGFHKVSDVRLGGPSVNDMFSGVTSNAETQTWEFQHPSFKRGHPELIPNIRRKGPKSGAVGTPSRQPAASTSHGDSTNHARSSSQYSTSEYEQPVRQPPESSLRRATSPGSPYGFPSGGPIPSGGPSLEEHQESVVKQLSTIQSHFYQLAEVFDIAQAETLASQERTFTVLRSLAELVSELNETGPRANGEEGALARRRNTSTPSLPAFPGLASLTFSCSPDGSDNYRPTLL